MIVSGRIIRGVGGLYTVSTEHGEYGCACRGIFRKKGQSPLVGDYVEIEEIAEEKHKGSIIKILERKNELVRPKVANIDIVFIVFSIIEPAINMDLLDRFLVTAEYHNIEPVIVFTKNDLLDNDSRNLQDNLLQMYEKAGYTVLSVSTVTNDGMDCLEELLKDKVSLFAGPSGVGKSSLINGVLKRNHMETGELSLKISRGKHTTRHAELIELEENSFVVDSPGFTTLEIENIEKHALPACFREFHPFIGICKFTNCKHVHEPFCCVKEHVGEEISNTRYERYKTFLGYH